MVSTIQTPTDRQETQWLLLAKTTNPISITQSKMNPISVSHSTNNNISITMRFA